MIAKHFRAKPTDFRSTYIEVGKPGCEAHYRAHWKTVDRWVEEEGKAELRAARKAYVKAGLKTKPKPVAIETGPEVDPEDLHAACQYLRERTNGGWTVGRRDDGRYFVGAASLTGAEVLERALAKGMDSWYVEADMMKRLALSDGVDQWVIDGEATA